MRLSISEPMLKLEKDEPKMYRAWDWNVSVAHISAFLCAYSPWSATTSHDAVKQSSLVKVCPVGQLQHRRQWQSSTGLTGAMSSLTRSEAVDGHHPRRITHPCTAAHPRRDQITSLMRLLTFATSSVHRHLILRTRCQGDQSATDRPRSGSVYSGAVLAALGPTDVRNDLSH